MAVFGKCPLPLNDSVLKESRLFVATRKNNTLNELNLSSWSSCCKVHAYSPPNVMGFILWPHPLLIIERKEALKKQGSFVCFLGGSVSPPRKSSLPWHLSSSIQCQDRQPLHRGQMMMAQSAGLCVHITHCLPTLPLISSCWLSPRGPWLCIIIPLSCTHFYPLSSNILLQSSHAHSTWPLYGPPLPPVGIFSPNQGKPACP